MREISRRYRSVVHPEVHFSPAKLNLYLAVTGRRADGFHDLVSLAVPLVWGDELRVTPTDGAFTLTCNDPAVPVDDTNLVLRAAHSFRTATGWTGGARFVLEKRIPMGAGLGGGSSNAAIALRALNHLAIHFQDEAQHAVSRRVLRPEVHREVAELNFCHDQRTFSDRKSTRLNSSH